MLRDNEQDDSTAVLRDKLHRAQSPTLDVMAATIADACVRYHALTASPAARRFRSFVSAQAWTEAALTLIELEVPQWKVRRVAYDAGYWHCSLSRQRDMPDWLDDTVDAAHESLPLAIVLALVDARIATTRQVGTRGNSVPSIKSRNMEGCYVFCCDNFH